MAMPSKESSISSILFFLSLQIHSILSKAKCSKGEYMDRFLKLCQKCTDCCPPRPQNEFCKKQCNFEETCSLGFVETVQTQSDASAVVGGSNFNHIICGVVIGLTLAFIIGLIFLFKQLTKSRSRDKEPSQQMLVCEDGDTKPKAIQDQVQPFQSRLV